MAPQLHLNTLNNVPRLVFLGVKVKSKSVVFLSIFVLSTLSIAGTDTAPASDLHRVPSGSKPQETTQTSQEFLDSKLLCGEGESAKHFDCEKVKPAIDKFKAEIGTALKLVDKSTSYSAISQSINNLIQSKEGVKSAVEGNKCSTNDGVGEDIWARNADKILESIINQKTILNENVKKIAELEKKDTSELLVPIEGIEPEMQLAVLKNRIKMYGEKLNLSDKMTAQFISHFSKAMNTADAASDPKRAGKILAIALDSMSPYQKEQLKHFANSFAKSEVDKDFRQAIQLAMNNWSANPESEKPETSIDECFSSTNKNMHSVREGFTEGMQKEVAVNRENFWNTVELAAKGDDPARAKLSQKWGKNLPAYMQSLRNMAKNATNAEEKKSAKESLAKIMASLGDKTKSESDPTNDKVKLNTYSIAMKDSQDKETKIEVNAKIDIENGPQEISIGQSPDDLRNYTLVPLKHNPETDNKPTTDLAKTIPEAEQEENIKPTSEKPEAKKTSGILSSLSNALNKAVVDTILGKPEKSDSVKSEVTKHEKKSPEENSSDEDFKLTYEAELTRRLNEPGALEELLKHEDAAEIAAHLVTDPPVTPNQNEAVKNKQIAEAVKTLITPEDQLAIAKKVIEMMRNKKVEHDRTEEQNADKIETEKADLATAINQQVKELAHPKPKPTNLDNREELSQKLEYEDLNKESENLRSIFNHPVTPLRQEAKQANPNQETNSEKAVKKQVNAALRPIKKELKEIGRSLASPTFDDKNWDKLISKIEELRDRINANEARRNSVGEQTPAK